MATLHYVLYMAFFAQFYGGRFTLSCRGSAFSTTAAIADYLRVAQSLDEQFPGFESDIHGLRVVAQEDGSLRHYVDCLTPPD